MNSILRTIELTTTMLAPIIFGQLFHFIGYIWTGAFIAGYNLFSVVFEYILLNGIYFQYPRLAHKIKTTQVSEEQPSAVDASELVKQDIRCKQNGPRYEMGNLNPSLWQRIIPKAIKESLFGWNMYFNHTVRYVH